MKPPYLENGARYCYGDNNEKICVGAMMGRRDAIPDDFSTVKKLHLRRVPAVSGGDYDQGGAYWGDIWTRPLYCAWGESDTEQCHVFFRAKDRTDAKAQALAAFPNARFFN